MATQEKVDVAIVGAGASGSVFAAVLAKAGKKVVILETGPDWQLSDLISSDFWGRRIKTAGAPFLLEGKNPFGYSYQSGWGVGGAALHYFANLPRLLPNDFKIRSEHHRALDWPISYQDVAPYYDKVARDIGVSGNARAEEIWRPAGEPYPMPPMKTFRNGEVWLKGFEAVGIRMVPAAVGMNSTDYRGRPACIYDGWCHIGCPTSALDRHARADQPPGHSRSRPRVLRREEGAPGAGGERGRAGGLVGAEPAPPAQLGDRPAPEGARQHERPRRQIHDVPLQLRDLGALRRGCPEPPGHHRRAIHVLRPLRQDGPPGGLRQLVHRRGHRAQDERSRRLRQRPARPVRSRAARVHEARRARGHPHRRVRRGIAEPRQPHRARRRQGRIRHAARQDPPQLRPGRGRAVERQLRGGPSHRQGHRRQGSVVGARQHADHPPHGRHHHGHRRGQLGGQQLRADPRAAEPLSRRAGHLPHGRSVESDLHDLCPLAARRRAARGEVEGGRPLRSARASAFSLLALANLLWAGNWVIGRALRDAFEPLALNFWRWLIAALVLAPFALPELARTRATLRRHAGLLALLALTGVAVFQTLVYLGLKTTTAMPCCSTLPPRCSCCCAPG